MGLQRVDRNDFRPRLEGRGETVADHAVGAVERIIAPDENAFGVLPAPAVKIGDGDFRSYCAFGDGDARKITQGRAPHVEDRPQGIEEAIAEVIPLPSRAAGLADVLGAVISNSVRAFALQQVHGLLPRDALPLICAPRADPLHRVRDAVGVVGVGDRVPALGAKVPQAGEAVRVSLDVDRLAVFDRHQRAAAAMAVAAYCTDDPDGRFGLGCIRRHGRIS